MVGYDCRFIFNFLCEYLALKAQLFEVKLIFLEEIETISCHFTIKIQ